FRADIEAVVRPSAEERKSNAGRKPFDAVMMFKIRRYAETDASVHDSQKLDEILDKANTSNEVWADSAYRSAEAEAKLKERATKAASIAAAPATTLYLSGRRPPTPRAHGCAIASNTCLEIRKTGWAAYSCVPLGWRVRP